MDEELRDRLDSLEEKVDEIHDSVTKIRKHFRREFFWKLVAVLVPVAAVGTAAWWLWDFFADLKETVSFGLF